MSESNLGIPQIPAGAQLGGAGTAENQLAAQQQGQQGQQQFQQPVQPTYEQQAPQEPQAPVVPQADPVLKPNEEVQVNPYKTDVPVGATYIESSIQHLSTELGVSADAFDSVIENALKHNDLSLINTHALGKDLTPEQAVRVQQLAQAAVQEVQQSVKAAQNEVYNVAGGEAQWDTAVNAFNANAPKSAQNYASYLADQGEFTQAAEYVLNYNNQGGYVNQQQQAPIQGGVGSVQTGLSSAEYSAEIGKIEREAGNRSLGSPAFAARISDLDNRRALGRQQGR